MDMPVFNSLYCEHCDVTQIIRATWEPGGFFDYENVHCPHCKTGLGEIRADRGFTIIMEKKGDIRDSEAKMVIHGVRDYLHVRSDGNSQFQGPISTREFCKRAGLPYAHLLSDPDPDAHKREWARKFFSGSFSQEQRAEKSAPSGKQPKKKTAPSGKRPRKQT